MMKGKKKIEFEEIKKKDSMQDVFYDDEKTPLLEKNEDRDLDHLLDSFM